LRQLAFIGGVLVNRAAHLKKIFFQNGFARLLNASLISWQSDRQQNYQDKHRYH